MKAIAENPATKPSPNEWSKDASFSIRTLLVAIDFSDESFRALACGIRFAERFAAAVHLIYVNDPHVPGFFSDSELTSCLQREMDRRFDRAPSFDQCHVRMGRPFQEINATAEEIQADLIVMATRGRTGLQHFMLGSTAEKVLRHSPCPVLIVRDHARVEAIPHHILVPVDFSDRAKEGAKYAAQFASVIGADLRLMHVVSTPEFVGADGYVDVAGLNQSLEIRREEAAGELQSMINLLPLTNVRAEAEVAIGAPVQMLLDRTEAADVDLIVTSTHGDSALRHVLLGSVAEELVRYSACPVLVVPSHKRVRAHGPAWDRSFAFADAWQTRMPLPCM